MLDDSGRRRPITWFRRAERPVIPGAERVRHSGPAAPDGQNSDVVPAPGRQRRAGRRRGVPGQQRAAEDLRGQDDADRRPVAVGSQP